MKPFILIELDKTKSDIADWIQCEQLLDPEDEETGSRSLRLGSPVTGVDVEVVPLPNAIFADTMELRMYAADLEPVDLVPLGPIFVQTLFARKGALWHWQIDEAQEGGQLLSICAPHVARNEQVITDTILEMLTEAELLVSVMMFLAGIGTVMLKAPSVKELLPIIADRLDTMIPENGC